MHLFFSGSHHTAGEHTLCGNHRVCTIEPQYEHHQEMWGIFSSALMLACL